ncbi:MAG TPA: response regulator [Terriglobales bacterium]|nr:response regulator [Terriglobales bacterium]
MPQQILLVEDEETILNSMADFLEAHGYVVDRAQELAAAQALLANYRYDLVITDLRLSSVNRAEGLSLIEEIYERYPWTKVILQTAYRSPEVDAECRLNRVHAVLDKPQPLPELLKVVRKVLGGEK